MKIKLNLYWVRYDWQKPEEAFLAAKDYETNSPDHVFIREQEIDVGDVPPFNPADQVRAQCEALVAKKREHEAEIQKIDDAIANLRALPAPEAA